MALGKLPEDDAFAGEGAIFADINITPLTDIFLVLLIIFMVSASVQVETASRTGVKVDLPKGAMQDINPGAKSLVVSVLSGGATLVQGQSIKAEDLEKLFASAAAKDALTQVIIEADTKVEHGRVVGIMEIARRVGLSKLAIATKGGGK